MFEGWTPETWAQVISAVGVLVAAFFAWRSAKASSQVGRNAVLVERLGRYETIHHALKGWGPAGDNPRREMLNEMHRTLRDSDELPGCKAIANPTEVRATSETVSDAIEEVEAAMRKIERELGV